jgi:hypothetical protein
MQRDERDLLVQVAANVDSMKDKQEHIEEKLDRHIEKDDTFMTKKFWMWATGLIFVLITGSYTYTSMVDDDIHKHSTNYGVHHFDSGD